MASVLQRIRKQIANLIYPAKNSMTIASDFLKYGNQKDMTADWTEVIMSDRDLYTGYSYAAIRNRANSVARIATENIRTESNKKDFVHPYLQIIDSSPTFSNYQFWQNISVYLDLEGVYYLMAIRAADGERIGNVKEFKMLNPYHIRRILSEDKLTVIGYVESRHGMIREIPPEMIIEIRDLNPFDDNNPFSMTDAAKESQFTLKTSGDYTRSTLRNNINAPGIISTDVLLSPEDFKNFTQRIKKHSKGEPLFGNGAGAINYQSMTNNLKDAALDKVDETNRDMLFSVAGVSKTMMGIEQSGTTRETAKVQKDLTVEGQILPRVQLILDALNQDFKNKYKSDMTRPIMVVDNPLATDHDSDLKEVEVKDLQVTTYQKLIDGGYDVELSAKFVMGEIGLDMLGKPTNKPIVEAKTVDTKKTEEYKEVQTNQTDKTGLIQQQEGSLKNSIVNLEGQMTSAIIERVRRKTNKKLNQFEDTFVDEGDVITETEKKRFATDLALVLSAFYGIIISLQGGQQMRDRAGQYSLPGNFTFNSDIRKYIKQISQKVANSHIDTISETLFEEVRKSALAGLSQQEIISNIRSKYSSQIVESRAKVIARTETNRAFTRAQFEADTQFVEQNKLQGRVFKQWVTRSSNPCPYCSQLASEPPIPFDVSFRELGDDVIADGNKLDVSFESLEAGNAHPNCSCAYELIIRSENSMTEGIQKQQLDKKELDDIYAELETIL